MRVEYLVLGIVLIVMGAAQTWLRHGPSGKKLLEEDAATRARTANRQTASVRSGRTWNAWTAILGGVGIVLGIVLIVMGALG